MFNLFDLLQAQGGTGVQGFGRQFGLSQDQAQRAMEAMLPAMTLGLQRNVVDDPTGMAKLFGLVGAKGPQGSASSPQMEAWVHQLFGSPHLGQAVLQQAATVSGVATPALKQMLPVMAGLVVAGIVHVMMNQGQSAPAPSPPPVPPSPFESLAGPYWTEMTNAFLSAAHASASGGSGGLSAFPPATGSSNLSVAPWAGTRSPPRGQAKASPTTPVDVFQQMVQSGIETQQENAKAMQRLFETFWREPGTPTGEDEPAPTGIRPGRGEPTR